MIQCRFYWVRVVLTGGLLMAAAVLPGWSQSSPQVDADSSERYWWASGGVGGSRTGAGSSFTVGVPLGRVGFLGGRYVHSEQSLELFEPGPAEMSWDAGPLAGLLWQGNFGHVALASGIVVVRGRRRGELIERDCFIFCSERRYEMRSFRAIGVPIDVQTFVSLGPYAGLGLHGYAAVSPDENLFGASVQVMIRISRS